MKKILKISLFIGIFLCLFPTVVCTISTGVIYTTFMTTVGLYLLGLVVFLRLFKKLQVNQNWWVAMISVFITLFLGEIFFRYGLGTYQGYVEKNGGGGYYSMYRFHNWFVDMRYYPMEYPADTVFLDQKTEFTYEHHYNNIGFRGKDVFIKKENEYRIGTFGDSFTECVGAPDDSTWSMLLERNYHENDFPDVSVINMGMSGSDPVYSLKRLQKNHDQIRFDQVVLLINESDLKDMAIRGGLERYDSLGNLHLQRGPWWEFFYGSSFIVRHVVHDIFLFDRTLVPNRKIREVELTSIEQLVDAVSEMDSFCVAKGIKFQVFCNPVSQDLEKGILSADMKTVCDKLSRNQIYCVDLTPLFLEKITGTEVSKYCWKLDGHYNSKGYFILAKIIFEFFYVQKPLLGAAFCYRQNSLFNI